MAEDDTRNDENKAIIAAMVEASAELPVDATPILPNKPTKNKGISELVSEFGNAKAEDVSVEIEDLATLAGQSGIEFDHAYLVACFDRLRNPRGGRGSHNRKAAVPTADRRRKRGAALPASSQASSEHLDGTFFDSTGNGIPSVQLDGTLEQLRPAIAESLLDDLQSENRALREEILVLREKHETLNREKAQLEWILGEIRKLL